MFRPSKLHVPVSRPKFAEGFPFELEIASKFLQEVGSSLEGFKDPTTQTNTSKSMEEVATQVV